MRVCNLLNVTVLTTFYEIFISPTVKCRLFQEITQNRKLIENAMGDIGDLSELLIEYNMKEFAKGISTEVIVDHVLEWNCNFKMRHFLSLFMELNPSHHSELLKWLMHILELSKIWTLFYSAFSQKDCCVAYENDFNL